MKAQKFIISGLLSVGFLTLLTAVNLIFSSNSSIEQRAITWGAFGIGAVCFSLAGYLITAKSKSTSRQDQLPISNTNQNLNPLNPDLLHSLETALEQQQWQEADKITAQLMLKAANQTIALTPEDLAHFPCELLSEIDQRWQIYSQNRFGFLAQLESLTTASALTPPPPSTLKTGNNTPSASVGIKPTGPTITITTNLTFS